MIIIRYENHCASVSVFLYFRFYFCSPFHAIISIWLTRHCILLASFISSKNPTWIFKVCSPFCFYSAFYQSINLLDLGKMKDKKNSIHRLKHWRISNWQLYSFPFDGFIPSDIIHVQRQNSRHAKKNVRSNTHTHSEMNWSSAMYNITQLWQRLFFFCVLNHTRNVYRWYSKTCHLSEIIREFNVNKNRKFCVFWKEEKSKQRQ